MNPFRLDGRVALVTGASRGIGAGIALGLAQAGADLILHSSKHPAIETEEQIRKKTQSGVTRTHCITADLADRRAAAELVKNSIDALGAIEHPGQQRGH